MTHFSIMWFLFKPLKTFTSASKPRPPPLYIAFSLRRSREPSVSFPRRHERRHDHRRAAPSRRGLVSGASASPRWSHRRRRDRAGGAAVQIRLPVASAAESADLGGFLQVDGLHFPNCWRQTVLSRAELQPPAGCLQKVSTFVLIRFVSTRRSYVTNFLFCPSADITNTYSGAQRGRAKTKAGVTVLLISRNSRCGSRHLIRTVTLTLTSNPTSHVSSLFLLSALLWPITLRLASAHLHICSFMIVSEWGINWIQRTVN